MANKDTWNQDDAILYTWIIFHELLHQMTSWKYSISADSNIDGFGHDNNTYTATDDKWKKYTDIRSVFNSWVSSISSNTPWPFFILMNWGTYIAKPWPKDQNWIHTNIYTKATTIYRDWGKSIYIDDILSQMQNVLNWFNWNNRNTKPIDGNWKLPFQTNPWWRQWYDINLQIKILCNLENSQVYKFWDNRLKNNNIKNSK